MREALRRLVQRRTSNLITAFLLGFLVAAPARAADAALIVFGEAASELEPTVRKALGGVNRLRLTPAGVTATDLAAARGAGLACGPESDECLVKLALYLRVEQLVALSAARTPEGITMDLTLIDAGLGKRTSAVSTIVTAQRREAKIEDAVLLLAAPDTYFAVVELNVIPADSRVLVDGEPQEAGRLRLRVGQHVIAVSHPGHVEQEVSLMIRPATTTGLSFTLRPLSAPAGGETAPRPLFVPGVVVAAVGGAAAVLGGATALILDASLLTEGAISGAEAREGALATERVAAGIAAVGVVAAAAGAVLCVIPE